ncbi:uncharacterized protein LOC141886611 isoform X1 [Acropora palmata]|uniref:uncharacterized protein LOC141886611 isoform X1 n=1 Tax=Acropora palmata TaxID=6131 RepID=UPI003DA16696
MYKTLQENPDFDGFTFTRGMTNPVNKAVFVRVVEAIHHDYGGKEQCPWTSAQLKVSCDVYYKSLSNANQRKRKNTEVGHRTTCRRTGRMGAKLEHRINALEKTTWCSETKEVVLGRSSQWSTPAQMRAVMNVIQIGRKQRSLHAK